MSALFRRGPSQASHLTLFHADGREWERKLPDGALQGLLQRVLAGAGPAADLQWQHSGQLGLNFLGDFWPEGVALPEHGYLRRAGAKGKDGLVVQADLPRTFELREYGEDLARGLSGKPRLREVDVEAEAAEVDAAGAGERVVVEAVPVAEPAPEPEPEPEPEPAVEVVMPGERTEATTGRSWTPDPNDLFSLAGEMHPDDLVDHGLEIRKEDLPWLNPGDAIHSPRRGPCRIKRVEDEAQQVVAKDENGKMLVLDFRELLAEFQFDDGQ